MKRLFLTEEQLEYLLEAIAVANDMDLPPNEELENILLHTLENTPDFQ